MDNLKKLIKCKLFFVDEESFEYKTNKIKQQI